MQKAVSPWRWCLTVYLLQGFPYVLITAVSDVLFQQRGISNAQNTLLTSILVLPWIGKFLWGALLEQVFNKRKWIITSQVSMAVMALMLVWVTTLSLSHFAWAATIILFCFVLFCFCVCNP